ncbi:unnamed protein product [Acanthoscelides obtectus]|uniref:Uncharacterized protein n=1 Tax=Acanthoscelides obtectus TaxID=200917 RepID=A0A9P0KXM7_ACAOB|nr:unnamed protein product [Acanthoscelides obtectus]CAK1650641.1 hypothetical protein AOBTE_LOCUS16843 [Acanthoscelides obtectus]
MDERPGPSKILSDDPNFADPVMEWLDECDSDTHNESETKSKHDSDSEQSTGNTEASNSYKL